ncbi:nSTAND1 domain-containing NTPase [Nocardia miyunensis]|uniref:WD40 domain-containing protein n=1 Tax=Nocardia miyunensis TaxID=282684 RepID=UPI0008316060|nr:PQQ-binding-like beta-propeller repeat protein [Nocardia miyunensis]
MTTTAVTTQLDADNPWPGLAAFEEDAREFFHGRDLEAELLLQHVLDAPVTVLYGRSGLGKTSLLRAGLFPLLREKKFLPVYVRFDVEPGAAPLTRQLHRFVRNAIRAEAPDTILPSDDESLWEYLHRADFELWSAQNYPLTPVIVLDQFEELFTLGERIGDLVRAFRDDLGDLAENRIPADLAARIDADEALTARFQLRSRNYRLVIVLREDFLPELEGWRRLIPALGRTRMRLLRLRGREAFDAVREPAGDLMTDALARRVVSIIAGEELNAGRDETALPDDAHLGDGLDGPEVEPALLSLFCRELNEERKRRGQSFFDEQLVEDAKRDILSNYYLSCVRDLPPRVAHFIESQLITEKGYRNSYAREDAVPSYLTDDELARLIRKRLLRLEERYGAQRIELTHDVLTGVVREHRDKRRAEEEKAALAAHTERQRAELQATQQYAAALRKRSRILAAVLAITAVITVVAVVLGFWALRAGNEARNNFQDTTSMKLETEGQGMLEGIEPGGDIRALQEILAAESLTDTPHVGSLYAAVVQRANTARAIKIPGIHKNAPMALSADGSRLASIAEDSHRVDIWDTRTGQAVGQPLTGGENKFYSIAVSPDGTRIAVGCASGEMLFWDARNGQLIGRSEPADSPDVAVVEFSPDGRRLASGSTGGTVRVWDPATGQAIGQPLAVEPLSNVPWWGIQSVAFSNDGERLAAGASDNSVRLWNIDTGQPIAQPLIVPVPPGHNPEVHSVAFSPVDHRLVSGHGGGFIGLWDGDTGQPIGHPIVADRIGVNTLTFSPDGHHVISGGEDGTLRLWNGDTIAPIGQPLRGHTGPVYGIAFSADGSRISSVDFDGTIRWWDAYRVRPLIELSAIRGAVFSGDRNRIAIATGDGAVHVFDEANGNSLGPPLTGHEDVITEALDTDGRRLATGDHDGTLRLWNTDTGKQIFNVNTTQDIINWIAFSPDGQRVATSGTDGTVLVWDARTGRLMMRVNEDRKVFAIIYSPDGKRIIAEVGSTIRQLDARTGEHIGRPIRGHDSRINDIAFSPDGRRIATAGQDGTVKLWDAEHWKNIRTLPSHQKQVTSIAYSRDGRLLVSGDASGTFRLWNAENGEPVGAAIGAHEDVITGLAFSPDGQRIVSASYDGTVRVWPAHANQADLWRDLCSKLTVNMSHQDWRNWVSPKIGYRTVCQDLPVARDDGSR